MKITRACLAGMHAACRETRTTCDCRSCHLGPCTQCGRDNLGRIFDGRCADCERQRAQAVQHVTYCERCATPGGFRNPSKRDGAYLCIGCQMDDAGSISSPVPVAALVSPCVSKDVSDPSHVWVSIRGTRFQCRCGAKKYDAKLRDQMRRGMMNS